MATPDDARNAAAAAYDAASDSYDHPANTFWARFGRETIERLGLRGGERVLDVCCGSGASAIPAAQAVGPRGAVLGIDLSEKLLALARAKANAMRLENVELQAGDLLDLRVPASHFDAVVCVFGVFFVPDMAAAARGLWRAVRRGGQLAITTWGPHFFEPASSCFWSSIQAVRPDLYKGFHPWDRISDPASLRGLLQAAGIDDALVVAEAGGHPIASPEAWWSAVLGSGYRGTIERLTAPERERVRAANLEFIRRSRIRSVEAHVVYARARKP
jgi:ubiquinone/menaquinone biosynthesis C-methylase UbiE